MGSLSGIFQRPVVAASAVAIASVSSDLHEKFRPSKSLDTCSSSDQLISSTSNSFKETQSSSWISDVSVSNLANFSFVTRIRVPVPVVKHKYPIPNTGHCSVPNSFGSTVASSPVLHKLYQSAELGKGPTPTAYSVDVPTSSSSSSEVLYRWHLPKPNSIDLSGKSDCSSAKSRTVVVLLGWLGARQKHLKRYADWYTSKGFHVITFTFPMAEVLSYQIGGKAEQHVDLLVNHLADWLEEENHKNLVFHTFSNTGWLTYGAILEKFQKQDHTLMGRIRGCIVDSAPVASPDPQVWASGFSAAFLKKHSVATQGYIVSDGSGVSKPAKPAITEAALLVVLEKLFEVVLNLPAVNTRLSNVLGQLTSGQPSCPQLYIYSSADSVIPVTSVESFIKDQQRSGHEVRSCNFISTPHVDHFRHDPKLYTSQLSQFLDDCVLTCCKHS